MSAKVMQSLFILLHCFLPLFRVTCCALINVPCSLVILADIDECKEEIHTCHDSTRCANDEGGYHCECKSSADEENGSCTYGCSFHGVDRNHGDAWTSEQSACSRCTCNKGVVTCQEQTCNCEDEQVDLNCCPACDDKSRCHHQESTSLTYRSGQTWVYQCQLCECMVSGRR